MGDLENGNEYLLRFTVLFLIDSRSRTSGARLQRLFNDLLDFGFQELTISELEIIIREFINQEYIFELDPDNSNEIPSDRDRLFFIKRLGRENLRGNDFDSNMTKLEIARQEYLARNSS